MRFTKPFWSGIADGSVTVAYRWWKRPTVVADRIYRTGGGRVRVTSVEPIELDSITARAARQAGHASLVELRTYLDAANPVSPADDESKAPDGTLYPGKTLYKVRFELVDEPDPREQLAAQTDLSPDEVAEVDRRLDRYDNAAADGPWTRRTLALIAQHPARRAPDLAEMVSRETKPFKLDVRKLKNLGLTHSLRIGYQLSPRGEAYLRLTADHQPNP